MVPVNVKSGSAFTIVFALMVGSFLDGGSTTTSAEEVEAVHWRLSNWGISRANTQPGERWAEAMYELTESKWTIEFVYGEALSPAADNLDGLRAGAFEMAMFCSFLAPGKAPLTTVFDLPFLATEDIYLQAELQMELFTYGPVADQLRSRWNSKILLPGPLPPSTLMSLRPIRSVEDFEGLRVTAPGVVGAALEEFGASPTVISPPEVYGALERGIIDGAVQSHTYAHYAWRTFEVGRYYILDLPLGTFDCPFYVNIDAWERLPEEWRELSEQYLEETLINDFNETYRVSIERDIGAQQDCGPETVFGDAGVECINFPPEEFERMMDVAAETVYQRWVDERGEAGQQVFDFFVQKREELLEKYGYDN